MRSFSQSTRNMDHLRFNLTLIRHAETTANSEGIIQGLMDTELSNIGYLQSQALGRYLQYHQFSHIYSSDLKRAANTTQQVRLFNQVSTCEITYEPLLRERRYGIAQGRTRQWLRELAKENGVPYVNFAPPGAETNAEVRERAVKFFQKLCQDLHEEFCVKTSVLPQSASNEVHDQVLSRSVSSEDLTSLRSILNSTTRQRASSTGNLQFTSNNSNDTNSSCRSSIDSALDLSSVSSDQQSVASSSSLISRNSSFEKHKNILQNFFVSPYKNNFSHLEVLVVSHGAVIRELIKYFACDLQTDIGDHFDTIQEIAPNTSITRFEITYSTNNDSTGNTYLKLVDYHSKVHLHQSNNEEINLDVVNKCNL